MNDEALCGKCGASRDVVWCLAWDEWLCSNHRHERSYRELDATEHPYGWAAAREREVTVTPL